MTLRSIITVGAIVSSGLAGGLFFGWLVSVVPGLSKTDDRNYISTMQNINVEIVNPGFLLAFLGAPILLILAGAMQYRAGEQRRGLLLIGAAATYVMGVLGVTFGGNVPLNNALDAFSLHDATDASVAERRLAFATPWNRWNMLRAGFSIVAFTLATASSLVSETE